LDECEEEWEARERERRGAEMDGTVTERRNGRVHAMAAGAGINAGNGLAISCRALWRIRDMIGDGIGVDEE